MSRSSYQYETSPRKYEPDYDIPRKRTQQTRRKNSTKKTTAMTGEKALTSLMYVQMTLYAAKSQRTYAKVRGEGRAMMRHTGIHMNQYLRAAGNDLESFRIRLKFS